MPDQRLTRREARQAIRQEKRQRTAADYRILNVPNPVQSNIGANSGVPIFLDEFWAQIVALGGVSESQRVRLSRRSWDFYSWVPQLANRDRLHFAYCLYLQTADEAASNFLPVIAAQILAAVRRKRLLMMESHYHWGVAEGQSGCSRADCDGGFTVHYSPVTIDADHRLVSYILPRNSTITSWDQLRARKHWFKEL